MKRYKQTFGNNMTTRSEPTITECKKKESWTKVTFEPDLSKFKMTHLEHDVVCLMRKRVYDMAGVLASSKLKVGTLHVYAARDWLQSLHGQLNCFWP